MKMRMRLTMSMTMTMICLIFFIYIVFIFTYKTFVVPFENSSNFSFDFSSAKKIITLVFATVDFISPVKVICCIVLESASNAFCLPRSAAIILKFFSNIENLTINLLCNHHLFLLTSF